jgi:hypothetical protein
VSQAGAVPAGQGVRVTARRAEITQTGGVPYDRWAAPYRTHTEGRPAGLRQAESRARTRGQLGEGQAGPGATGHAGATQCGRKVRPGREWRRGLVRAAQRDTNAANEATNERALPALRAVAVIACPGPLLDVQPDAGSPGAVPAREDRADQSRQLVRGPVHPASVAGNRDEREARDRREDRGDGGTCGAGRERFPSERWAGVNRRG